MRLRHQQQVMNHKNKSIDWMKKKKKKLTWKISWLYKIKPTPLFLSHKPQKKNDSKRAALPNNKLYILFFEGMIFIFINYCYKSEREEEIEKKKRQHSLSTHHDLEFVKTNLTITVDIGFLNHSIQFFFR